jgi:hypothetical protein
MLAIILLYCALAFGAWIYSKRNKIKEKSL